MSLNISVRSINENRHVVNGFFNVVDRLYKTPDRPTSQELRYARQEAKKKLVIATPEIEIDLPVIPVRNLVLDANNRIIGALDMNNKMRRLWPTTSAFLPRKEEIDPKVFEQRLEIANFMVRVVKDITIKLFQEMRVDDVFSTSIIDTHLSIENQIETLAHFNTDDDFVFEKMLLAVLQAAAYAHAIEKNFVQSDLDNLAVDLNPDIIAIKHLLSMDSSKEFETAASVLKATIASISKEVGATEEVGSVGAAFAMAVVNKKKL